MSLNFHPSRMVFSPGSSTTTFPEDSHDDISRNVEKKTVDSNYDPFLARFDLNDPANPKNWSHAKKWYLTLASSVLHLNVTLASTATSVIIQQLQDQFGFSKEVGGLTIALFIVGFCVGPLLWGPLSEQYGRRPIFIITFFVFACLQVGCALSNNTASILVLRLLSGTVAAAPLVVSGAVLSDIWNAGERGTPMCVFTVAPFVGPGVGPVIAGYIVLSGLQWRWLFWTLAIVVFVCWLQILFTMPETYEPVLLAKKAEALRKQTGDTRYYAARDKEQAVSLGTRIEIILGKPFRILIHEPMVIAITAYMSFVYSCIYTLFEAYPIVFTEGHNLNSGASGLVFLPIPIGAIIAAAVYIIVIDSRYKRKQIECAPNPVPPEVRLEVAMIAAPLFCVSFFWFAWTSDPSINIWAPMLSGVLLGFSTCWIFLALLNYTVDAYLIVAASALAANTVVRSLVGCAFSLFATVMYEKLGPQWASSLLGFIALLMAPIPFVLTKYGHILRRKSKYAPSPTPIITNVSSIETCA